MLLCNLPYVPDEFKLNEAAMNEPRLAIFGGHDGLNLYHKLFGQISGLPEKLVVEVQTVMTAEDSQAWFIHGCLIHA